MVALNPRDSAILTRVAQFDHLPDADREAMLSEASDTAREIGRVVIRRSRPRNAEVRHAAQVLRDWAAKNKLWSKQRRARLARAR